MVLTGFVIVLLLLCHEASVQAATVNVVQVRVTHKEENRRL